MNPANRLAQLSFTAGPAALLGGWFLMRPIDGDPQPGPWWTSAHVVWLIGFLMLGLMTLAMRGLAGPVRGGRRVAVEAVTGIALFSVAANLTGLVIDLYAGLTAADEDAMRALMTQVKGYPGVELVVYSPGRSSSSARCSRWRSSSQRCAGSRPSARRSPPAAWCWWGRPPSWWAGTRRWPPSAWPSCGSARCCWAGAGPASSSTITPSRA
ncbi:hypothetical protein ACFQYP_35525 [Nonomuraea antimicrobica]